ncbi:MAG: redoxin family protein [Planctomycetes bacterium]|nr:redoxin family protein [Planctomycetota bacterium]
MLARHLLTAVLGLSLGAAGGEPPARDDGPVKLGEPVPRLTFKDIRYVPRTLDDLPGKKAYVLVFTTTQCPVVQHYMPVLKRLDAEYRERGVQFVSINVGSDDSIMDMAEHALQYEIEFPVVKDFDAVCARTLGVPRTPQAIVLDERRTLRYRGRIDDQYRVGGTQPAATRRELRDAIEAVLASGPVPTPETAVDGCLITRSEWTPPAAPVTYAEHVAPILRKHCVSCHRPGTAAPFALTSHSSVAGKADMIAEVVAEQRMPPWYGSPRHGNFINRRGLTADERATIIDWVRTGKPRGDESKLPRAETDGLANRPTADGKWLIGRPDLIIEEATAHELPAEGVIPYKYVVLPHLFAHETWLQGVQILPDNPAVVHHCNMGHMRLGEKPTVGNFITGFVPGGDAMALDSGVAVRIPAGSMLALQVHFVTTGKPEKCRLAVGLRYARGVVQKQLRLVLLENKRFAIPPGAALHLVGQSQTLDRDGVGVGLFAHMHFRGRDMTFLAHPPNEPAEAGTPTGGTSETLLVIPNYSFEWQHSYRWAPGAKRLPKGTRIECIAHYDNSPFNPYNPDPTATVREGPQTFQEMMNGFFFYVDEHERLELEIDPATGAVRS